MNDLSLTRIFAAEHSYPTPTRNHLSMHNREASKRKDGRPTKAGEVRFGIIAPDGTRVMAETATEKHTRRQEELANIALERQQRSKALADKVAELMAETDTWASKS